MQQFRDLTQLEKVARKAAKKNRAFLVSGSLLKAVPQWLPDKLKPTKLADMTHAQWTAMWWARALSQLTVQVSAGRETVSVEALLCEFLDGMIFFSAVSRFKLRRPFARSAI